MKRTAKGWLPILWMLILASISESTLSSQEELTNCLVEQLVVYSVRILRALTIELGKYDQSRSLSTLLQSTLATFAV